MINKKWILSVIIVVSSCLLGTKVEAASAVNNYIINNNIKPVGEALSLGRIYNQNTNKNGGINMDYTGGKPRMVVIHEVGVDGGTINGSIDYMVRTQDSAFVHSFVDGSQLITIADKGKKSWGSGGWGNQYGIQIEQMRVTTSVAFYKQIVTLAKWTADQMIIYDMGAPKLMSSPSSPQRNDLSIKPDGNLASHRMIAYKFNQTTSHVDPDEYWARFGYDMNQFRDLVEYYYNQLEAPKITSTSVEGNPATGDFKVRVKTSGAVTKVSVPIWSHANGQDDLFWYPATKVKDGEYLATFDGVNHNYESGLYAIHAYAYNSSKQTSSAVNNNLQVNYPTTPIVHYQTHVESIGWQQSVVDGITSGTVGKSLRVEAIKLAVTGNVSGGIQYQTHVQSIGWQNSVANNALSGTTGKSLRVEAVRIDFTGDLKSKFDIYYRVQSQDRGWLGWAKNGESAGTQGFSQRLETMQVKLVKKGTAFDVGGDAFFDSELAVNYQTHVQDLGWQAAVKNGDVSGTSGKSLRLEGIKIDVANVAFHKMTGGIQYQTHVQKIGWQNPVSDNALSGTTGQALRLEAIRINLTGTLSQNYDVYYRVHVQDRGWLGWAKNGASAGSEGQSLRLEAIQINLVKKGTAFDAGGIAFVMPPLTTTPTPVPTPTPLPAPTFDLSKVTEKVKLDWFNATYPEAQRLAKANDLFPSIMMSQALAESAWGQSELATKANNLFGIKADATWKGAIYTKVTNEVVNGQTIQVTANFRKYSSQAESLRDYVTKIKTTKNGSAYRYQAAWRSNAKNYQNAAQALQAGGYATDPNYATNLINRISNYRLDALD